jgi:hypothetical protein
MEVGRLVAGRVTSFIILILIFAAIIYNMQRAKARLPQMRRIAGLDAIEEAVGRATEMGRPVFFTPGMGDVTTSTASETFAALEMMSYTAQLTARNDTDLVVGVAIANVYPLSEQVVEQAYLQSGRPDAYHDDMVRFLSPTQFAYASACMGIIEREKVASTIMAGRFLAEAMLLAEVSSQVGAISIAGTGSEYQLPFFIAACDYTLLGEELLAAGAYLAKDPVRLGSLAGQDWSKLLALVMVIIGAIMVTFTPKPPLLDLLKK